MGQSRCIKPTQHSACGKTEYFPCELSVFGIITTHLPSCCQHRVRHRPTIQSRAGCSLVRVQLGQQPGVCEMSTATQLLTSGHCISSRMLDCGQRLDFTFICRDGALACHLLALQISSGERLQTRACFIAVLLAAKCSSYHWSLLYTPALLALMVPWRNFNIHESIPETVHYSGEGFFGLLKCSIRKTNG